jgi:hypothetical protein
MDRDLGMPKKSQESPSTCATMHMAQPVLPLKQTRRGLHGDDSKCGLVQSAHYKDATFNKEFYR